jgi:CrcB protein
MSGHDLILVFIGGGTGSLIRWLAGLAVGRRYKGSFPLGTFLINVTGAFLIGFLAELFSLNWRNRFGDPINTLILTGVMGGYTTFSSLELDFSTLLHRDETSLAQIYLLSSIVISLLAAYLGRTLALWL